MFELSMYYYIVGCCIVLLLAILVSFQVRRRKRERQQDRTLYISALQALLAGDQVGAFYKLKETVAQDTENIDAYLRLGKILADRGKTKQAIQVHNELLLRSNLSPLQKKEINRYLIDDFVLDNQTAKAISLLQAEFERDQADAQAGTRLLELLEKESKWEEAEVIAEKLYKRDRERFAPKVADMKIKVGDLFEERGKGRKARTLYKTAFHLDPTRMDTWVKVGDSYTSEERMEDAIRSWMHIVESAPREAHVVFDRLKRALFEVGQFNQMAGIFERIIEQDPGNPHAALALAELYEKKGNLSQAEEYYRQTIDSNPQYTPARLGLARLYREQGRIDEALSSLEKLFKQQQQGAVRQQI
jgi:lipopolysaccharide assembly protein B